MNSPTTTYQPVNHCVYCGRSDVPLSDEHIIPLALNGTLILPKASCKDCADITKKFEQTVARTIYGPLRIKLGFKTRRKRERPDRLSVQYVDNQGEMASTTMPVEEYPNVYLAVEFPPPGILTGAPVSEMNPEMQVSLRGNQEEIKRAISSLNRENIQLSNMFAWGAFCRQIAKIAHCFAIATIGTQGYRPLLTDIILGKSSHLSHLVGGVHDENNANASDLSVFLESVQEVNYLTVHVQLLGTGRLPVYQAVVGEIINIDILARKVKSIEGARLN